MIHYRGMTFCTEGTCAKRNSCSMYFTEEHKRRAVEWWGGEDFPLCIYVDTPKCYEPSESKSKEIDDE